uniref:Trehalase n=1 Tax=Heterorhabditis bacteriophora TaxID=37862 RepID=A0A1I7WJK5_HETBA
MPQTTQGIIENFANIIMTNGFIPNSGNIQQDLNSVKRWVLAMEREIQFWLTNRTIIIGPKDNARQLFLFKVETTCPRPENFMVDYQIGLKSGDPESTWRAIASACESGWDFSTRWFDHDGERRCEFNSCSSLISKSSIRTHTIVPVGLNIFMALNMKYLSDFYTLLENEKNALIYNNYYKQIVDNVKHVMWNETEGSCFNFFSKFSLYFLDVQNTVQSSKYFPSLSMTFCHLSGNFRILSLKNDISLEAMKSSIHFRTSTISLKRSPARQFYIDRNKCSLLSTKATKCHLTTIAFGSNRLTWLKEFIKQHMLCVPPDAQDFFGTSKGISANSMGENTFTEYKLICMLQQIQCRICSFWFISNINIEFSNVFCFTNSMNSESETRGSEVYKCGVQWFARSGAWRYNGFQLEHSSFMGHDMHTVFVISFVSVMIFIAVWIYYILRFMLSGFTNGRVVFLTKRSIPQEEIDSKRPLLDDSDE